MLKCDLHKTKIEYQASYNSMLRQGGIVDIKWNNESKCDSDKTSSANKGGPFMCEIHSGTF